LSKLFARCEVFRKRTLFLFFFSYKKNNKGRRHGQYTYTHIRNEQYNWINIEKLRTFLRQRDIKILRPFGHWPTRCNSDEKPIGLSAHDWRISFIHVTTPLSSLPPTGFVVIHNWRVQVFETCEHLQRIPYWKSF